jgi:hypothetical protein
MLQRRIEQQNNQIKQLQARIEQLETQMKKNSTNSHLPHPSEYFPIHWLHFEEKPDVNQADK